MHPALRSISIATIALAIATPLAAATPRTVLARVGPGASPPIAMDGGRVAVADYNRCGLRVRLVRLADSAVQPLPHGAPCGQDGSLLWRQGDGPALALGRRSVLAVAAETGNFLYPQLIAGSPVDPLHVVLGDLGTGVEFDTGPFIGPVVASGTARVYATYSRTWLPAGCDPAIDSCTLSPATGSITRFPGAVSVYAGSDAIIPDQMEGSRIALRGEGGSARVVALDGTLLADVPTAKARAVAVAGDSLVVLRRDVRRVDVRDATTGVLLHSYALPGTLRLLRRIDVAVLAGKTWAVVATKRDVYALRLGDGHAVRLVHYLRATVTDVQIEHAGVVWSLQRPVPNPGWAVVFAPLPGSAIH